MKCCFSSTALFAHGEHYTPSFSSHTVVPAAVTTQTLSAEQCASVVSTDSLRSNAISTLCNSALLVKAPRQAVSDISGSQNVPLTTLSPVHQLSTSSLLLRLCRTTRLSKQAVTAPGRQEKTSMLQHRQHLRCKPEETRTYLKPHFQSTRLFLPLFLISYSDLLH